jgi:hypothetical protein
LCICKQWEDSVMMSTSSKRHTSTMHPHRNHTQLSLPLAPTVKALVFDAQSSWSSQTCTNTGLTCLCSAIYSTTLHILISEVIVISVNYLTSARECRITKKIAVRLLYQSYRKIYQLQTYKHACFLTRNSKSCLYLHSSS